MASSPFLPPFLLLLSRTGGLPWCLLAGLLILLLAMGERLATRRLRRRARELEERLRALDDISDSLARTLARRRQTIERIRSGGHDDWAPEGAQVDR